MHGMRDLEWEKMKNFLSNENQKIAVIYGRPGTGLSQLIKEIRAFVPCLYFPAYPGTQDMELKLFGESIGISKDQTDSSEMDRQTAGKLTDILDWIGEQARDHGQGRPIILLISNYKNFINASFDNDGTLCHYVRDLWKDLPIKVIIADDSVLTMQRNFFSPKSLWGNIDPVEISLSPLTFRDIAPFLKGYSWRDAILLYGMIGGLPDVFREICQENGLSDQKKGVPILSGTDGPSIMKVLFDPWERKSYHPETVLKEEVREPGFYNRLMTALASGHQRVGELSLDTGKNKDIVAPYLNTLVRLGLVEKDRPITEKGNQRKSRYSITNTMDLFYYRYLAPHYDLLCKGEFQKIWKEVILPDRSTFEKIVFEKIAGQYLFLDQRNDLPFQIEELGSWWEYARKGKRKFDRVGFDLIGRGSWQGRAMQAFCRINYDERPVDVSEIKDLIALSRKLAKGGKKFYLIFSRAGFEQNAETVAKAIPEIIFLSIPEIIEEGIKSDG